MPREITRQPKGSVGTRWERFLRSVKRIITAVTFIVIAAVAGLLTQRATDMPVQEIAILGDMQHVSRATGGGSYWPARERGLPVDRSR
jgi:hypothetical protein